MFEQEFTVGSWVFCHVFLLPYFFCPFNNSFPSLNSLFSFSFLLFFPFLYIFFNPLFSSTTGVRKWPPWVDSIGICSFPGIPSTKILDKWENQTPTPSGMIIWQDMTADDTNRIRHRAGEDRTEVNGTKTCKNRTNMIESDKKVQYRTGYDMN